MSIKDKISGYFSGIKNKASLALMQKILNGNLTKEQVDAVNQLVSDITAGKIKDQNEIKRKMSHLLSINEEDISNVMSDLSNMTANKGEELSQYFKNTGGLSSEENKILQDSMSRIQKLKEMNKDEQMKTIEEIQNLIADKS